MKAITAMETWRASRSLPVGTFSAPMRFDAPVWRTRGWSGVTWRELQ